MRRWRSPKPLQRGFTLPELLIVLAVAALLLTIGLSSFNRFIGETQADTVINRLRTALSLARAEAVNRSTSVVLCRRAPGSQNCADNSAWGKQEWNAGWLVFMDADADRLYDASAGDELLRVFEPLPASFVLKWNRGSYIDYGAMGALNSGNGTFCLGDRDGTAQFQRELVIPSSGRVRATSNDCSYTLLP